MFPAPDAPSAGAKHAVSPDTVQTVRALALQVAAESSLASAANLLSLRLAPLVNAPVALLSQDRWSCRFEAHGFPDASVGAIRERSTPSTTVDVPRHLQDDSGDGWTAIALGWLGDREWTLLIPGPADAWASRPGFEQIVKEIGWGLGAVASRERADYESRCRRKLHAFNRRLARETDGDRLNALVLRTLASQVLARTGALAVFNDGDDALEIVSTLGYPRAIVEHLRIRSGEGVMGRAHATSQATLGDSRRDLPRRLRYHTDSYMALPITAGADRLAVVTLTDRADGRPFDQRDFETARLFAGAAASAFSRQRLRAHLGELTELATVDPLTGLFNRRYFETRLQAEVERARREHHDLALLLIDLDDFKRVNDMRGHLVGDRTLRDVADLLRAGVRIFDVCARYGGEEFAIVMPAASLTVAQQVAERIRGCVERNFIHASPRVAASIGVGLLGTHATADELIGVADRALIAAKNAGKNRVWTSSESLPRIQAGDGRPSGPTGAASGSRATRPDES